MMEASASHAASPDAVSSVRGRVVVLLPRGETWRNFVYTGVLDTLARSNSLTVLSIVPNSELWEMLQSRYDDVRELQATPEPWVVRIQRELLDLAHGRWLWSEAAKERWRLRDLEATTLPLKMKRVVKKAVCRTFASDRGLRLLENTQRQTSRVLGTFRHFTKLYREQRPSLVFNASHVHSHIATPAIEAARSLNIPTATFLFSWDNLTSQGRIIPPYDYYLVWNEAIRGQLLQLYPSIRAEQVFVTGTPQFDSHFQPQHYRTREEFCRQIHADPGRPMVLYTTGMANHMPGEHEIVAGIADALKELTDCNSPQLLLRVYPKDRTGRFDRLIADRPDIINCKAAWESNWYTPLPEDAVCLVNALRHVDLGINVASTVSLELLMFDKPVLNVGYNPPSVPSDEMEYARYYQFDHYRPICESRAVDVVYSQSDLKLALRRLLREPNASAFQRKRLLSTFFGNTLDGRSAERIAEVLKHVSRAECRR